MSSHIEVNGYFLQVQAHDVFVAGMEQEAQNPGESSWARYELSLQIP
jgi:hypothetical protein